MYLFYIIPLAQDSGGEIYDKNIAMCLSKYWVIHMPTIQYKTKQSNCERQIMLAILICIQTNELNYCNVFWVSWYLVKHYLIHIALFSL